ncbi:hypothetical protein EVAR_96968_1 [Eumeta japonica]|uniref:Uncharacterized protein n=1 Tax=Eumeta variegata TaxID=151549 RepID=A0A4C1VGX0_EUMVA|nr:hypothetical protein EVAR_96968_1 [Eumeta japonica]
MVNKQNQKTHRTHRSDLEGNDLLPSPGSTQISIFPGFVKIGKRDREPELGSNLLQAIATKTVTGSKSEVVPESEMRRKRDKD